MGLFLQTWVPELVSDRFRDGIHQARAPGILNLRDDQCAPPPKCIQGVRWPAQSAWLALMQQASILLIAETQKEIRMGSNWPQAVNIELQFVTLPSCDANFHMASVSSLCPTFSGWYEG